MHRPSWLMVLSSIFTAGSLRVVAEEDGIPFWVWPVLILMVGFLVWWWLRKPVEEVSAPHQPDRCKIPTSGYGSRCTGIPGLCPAGEAKNADHRAIHGPTPRPVTAESPAQAEPEEEPDQKLPEVSRMDVQPDDLTIVEGIGPKINQVLHTAGIQSLSQLADCEVTQLKDILISAGIRLADPATWPEQAKLAAVGDQETLKALQATLKGGRKV